MSESRYAQLKVGSLGSDNTATVRVKQWNAIAAYRDTHEAVVDTVGCERLYETHVSEEARRYQVLLSLILSIQSRDEKTAQAMENLRSACGSSEFNATTIEAMDDEVLLQAIKPAGLYAQKLKYIRGSTRKILDEYDGDIPSTMKELKTLNGVGNKVASLVMTVAWRQTVHVAVDTHVNRISQRLGWAKKAKKGKKSPDQTMKELEDWLPRHLWAPVNHMLVGFGQTVCKAKNPLCSECPVNDICPASSYSGEKKAKRIKSGQ